MRRLGIAALVVVMMGGAMPAAAQTVEGRVDRLEREMRAVQRKVFPGGTGQTVEAQITAPTQPVEIPGTPAGGAITDLTERVSALETSVRSVTGQVEQASYRLRQLEEAFAAYRQATDTRLKALESAAAPLAAATDVGAAPDVLPGQVAASGNTAAPTRPRQTRPAPVVETAAAEPVAGVERPSTGDAAEDGYTYGYRLWSAKQYPEAAVALKAVADKYPRHRRASFAQNLLGRAYLDDGKPSLASLAFYDSYKKWPEGERAPDSLFYLAQALVKLKKPAGDVCKVYTELTEVYATKLTTAMKADIAKGRAAQKCA
ncbi:hypothetical protein [Sphingomonas sp. RS2018]